MPWSCEACTFSNADHSTNCDICNTPKPVTDNSWTCNNCTFLNVKASSTRCDMCNGPKASGRKKKKSGRSTDTKQGNKRQKKSLEEIFTRFEDKVNFPGFMVIEEKEDAGLALYFQELGIQESALLQYALFWKLDCQTEAEIAKKEFLDGWSEQKTARNQPITSIKDMKTFIQGVGTALQRDREFANFYKWLFDFAMGPEAINDRRLKNIPLDLACEIFEDCLDRWHSRDHFVAFLREENEAKRINRVSKDLWDSLWPFFKVRANGSNWADVDDGSYPSAIDSFVEYMRRKGHYVSS